MVLSFQFLQNFSHLLQPLSDLIAESSIGGGHALVFPDILCFFDLMSFDKKLLLEEIEFRALYFSWVKDGILARLPPSCLFHYLRWVIMELISTCRLVMIIDSLYYLNIRKWSIFEIMVFGVISQMERQKSLDVS